MDTIVRFGADGNLIRPDIDYSLKATFKRLCREAGIIPIKLHITNNKHSVGRYNCWVEQNTGRVGGEFITISRKLTKDETVRAIKHEISHCIHRRNNPFHTSPHGKGFYETHKRIWNEETKRHL